jgi:hypothetical protein
MSGFVNADFTAARKGESGEPPPTLLTHLRDFHVFQL